MSHIVTPGNAPIRGLRGCTSIEEFRALAPLPDEAQRVIDQAVINVGLERLTIAADLMAGGLVYNLPNPLSITELYHEKVSKVGYAKRVMSPSARGENQIIDRTGVRTPIYITMDDFSIDIRTFLMSQRVGAPLDTAQAAQSTRRVNESIEDAVINGPGITVGGNTAYGLLNAPNVNTATYSSGESWTNVAHDGSDILGDVLDMIETLQGDNFYGPYTLYVPTAYGIKLAEDFKANSDLTIRQRLEEIDLGADQRLRIRVADRLPTDRTVMLQMTSDVLDLIVGQQPTVVSWEDNPGWERFFAVMAIVIPRIKDTYTGQSGILKGYTS